MKILIAGSRSIESFDLTPYISETVELIISGGANGVDRLAEEFADRKGISKLVLRPKYKIYGKRAPLLRNEIMVDLADEVLLIWDGASRGTEHTLKYAEKKGKKLTIIKI